VNYHTGPRAGAAGGDMGEMGRKGKGLVPIVASRPRHAGLGHVDRFQFGGCANPTPGFPLIAGDTNEEDCDAFLRANTRPDDDLRPRPIRLSLTPTCQLPPSYGRRRQLGPGINTPTGISRHLRVSRLHIWRTPLAWTAWSHFNLGRITWRN
jgi:hypothetical protein